MILKLNSSLRDYILKKYDQIDIFAHYLNVTTDEISVCINNRNKKIHNTLRPDENPSVGFRYNNNNKLIMRDFGNSFYTGDCFYIAGLSIGLNCNNPTHFIDICKNIDAYVNKKGVVNSKLKVFEYSKPVAQLTENLIIPTYREVNKYDIDYFKRFEISKEQIEKYYTPAETAINTVNDYVVENYLYDRRDPCYVINLGIINQIPRYKLYFPARRTGKKPRFRTNYTLNLEDISKLRPNSNLIIQKSLKDELTLGNFLKTFDIHNTDITRISSESIVLNQREIDVIKCRYPNVYTMFDNDSQGNVAANIHREKYNITPIYMVDLLKITFPEMKPIIEQNIYSPHIPKNISDFREMYGKDKTTLLTQTLIKHYL